MSKKNQALEETAQFRWWDLLAIRDTFETERRRHPVQRRIRLVPGHPVHLLALGYIDDRAFARVFRNLVWPRIPKHHQDSILHHWEADAGKWRAGPSIAVLPDLSRFGAALGVCCPCCHYVWFWAGGVGCMPREPLATLIAHELAHVAYRATGHPWSDEVEREEEATRTLQRRWGFDPQVPVQWFRGHVLDALKSSARRDPRLIKGFLRKMRAFAHGCRLSD